MGEHSRAVLMERHPRTGAPHYHVAGGVGGEAAEERRHRGHQGCALRRHCAGLKDGRIAVEEVRHAVDAKLLCMEPRAHGRMGGIKWRRHAVQCEASSLVQHIGRREHGRMGAASAALGERQVYLASVAATPSSGPRKPGAPCASHPCPCATAQPADLCRWRSPRPLPPAEYLPRTTDPGEQATQRYPGAPPLAPCHGSPSKMLRE